MTRPNKLVNGEAVPLTDDEYADWLDRATPKAPTQAELRAYAAFVRYAKETGGITIQGIPIPIATDRDSQAMINGAFNLVSAEPSTVIKFKTPGGFVELDAAAMTAIAVAVGQHVQAVFATEAQVNADIESRKIRATSSIDAAFGSK